MNRKFVVPLLAVLHISAVDAQENKGPALEEITVTAQRRAERMQDVPVAMSALSGSDLEALNLGQSSDLASQVPNLMATETSGNGVPIFSLRGVSMSDFSFNQSSPVAVYVDEVYKGSAALQGVQLYDLERVEVLRGPQGTLYGKNSTGGAVNFITRTPSMETGGYIGAGIGEYSRVSVNAAFETALIEDELGIRIAGVWNEADGWFENIQDGIDAGEAVSEYGIRATIGWQPSDAFDLTLHVATSDQDAVNHGIQPFNISAGGVGAGLYGLYGLLGATTLTDYTRDGVDFFEFDSDQDAKRILQSDAIALRIDWDLTDALTLTSLTSWDDGEIFVPEDPDGSPNLVITANYTGETEQLTQDLRLSSETGGAFDFIVGLYYSEEETFNSTTLGFWQDLDLNVDGALDFNDCLDPLFTSLGLGQATPAGAATETVLNSFGLSLADFVPGGCQVQNDFNQNRDSFAVYFDGTAHLGDAIALRFGLRYTEDDTELEGFSARILGNDSVPLLNTIPGDPVDPFARVSTDSFTDDEWTGRLGIDFTLESGALLYASYNTGYRSGAYNAQAFFDPSELTRVMPEKMTGFEVGFKSELLDGRMRLNGAAFTYDYENQQFLDIDPATAAQTLINIDESEVSGLELDLTALPTDNLKIRAGLGLLDTEVKSGTLSGVNLSGNELLLAPEFNFNFAAEWTVLTNSAGSLTLMADTTYVDDHYFEILNIERMLQTAYWIWNGRIQFDSADDKWAIGVWGKNLAEEEYRTSAIDLAGFGFDYSHIGAPRTFGADIVFRF